MRVFGSSVPEAVRLFIDLPKMTRRAYLGESIQNHFGDAETTKTIHKYHHFEKCLWPCLPLALSPTLFDVQFCFSLPFSLPCFPVPYPSFLLLSVVLCPLLLNRIFGQWVVGVGWWFCCLVVMVAFFVF